MPQTTLDTVQLLENLRLGDAQARNRLIDHACQRLRCLTHKMLRDYPGVRRWEQTDDVLHNAVMRLCRALEVVTPQSPRHFWNLAALQLRRELIDLAHHYFGPEGLGTNHHTDGPDEARGQALERSAGEEEQPVSLEEWRCFHEWVGALPEEDREVFDLLWYQGLTQEQAASVLSVSLSTVKRRWQAARLRLGRAMSGEWFR